MGIISAVLELIVLSVPSGIYLAMHARRGHMRQARGLLGLCRPISRGWALAVGVLVITTAAGYAASRGIAAIDPALLHPGAATPGPVTSHAGHTGRGSDGLSVTIAAPAGVDGYAAIVVTTLAEEMLFRGFLAGLLIRALGFARGNAVQAVLFLAPHALLLVVNVAFWPLLPAQLLAGWLLGWLRHRSGSIAPGWIAHAANILAPTLLAPLTTLLEGRAHAPPRDSPPRDAWPPGAERSIPRLQIDDSGARLVFAGIDEGNAARVGGRIKLPGSDQASAAGGGALLGPATLSVQSCR